MEKYGNQFPTNSQGWVFKYTDRKLTSWGTIWLRKSAELVLACTAINYGFYSLPSRGIKPLEHALTLTFLSLPGLSMCLREGASFRIRTVLIIYTNCFIIALSLFIFSWCIHTNMTSSVSMTDVCTVDEGRIPSVPGDGIAIRPNYFNKRAVSKDAIS